MSKLGAVLLATGVLVAACGGDDEAATDTDADDTDEPDTTDADDTDDTSDDVAVAHAIGPEMDQQLLDGYKAETGWDGSLTGIAADSPQSNQEAALAVASMLNAVGFNVDTSLLGSTT